MRISRRNFLATGALGVLGLGVSARWIEPNRVTVTRHTLGTPGSHTPTLRLVQLTDLHLQAVERHERAVGETVHRLRPDVIVITGDSIDRPESLGALAEFLSLLPAAECYATLGNWEHWSGVSIQELKSTYEHHGARLLVNESTELLYEQRRVLLTGLDDATAGTPLYRQALSSVEPAGNHLLLAHTPTYRDDLPAQASAPRNRGSSDSTRHLQDFSPEYMLSGHTHGGQIQLFGWAPLRPPGSGRYVDGWYRGGLPHLYVSRGIGTSILPIRFGAPPEIALFEWSLR